MANQPESADSQSSPAGIGTAGPARAGRRKRRPLLAALAIVLAIGGLAAAGIGISRQVMPRTFTPAQRRQIESWEVARRWRVIPKQQIFPTRILYRLPGAQIQNPGVLTLAARRLEIASQAGCVAAAASNPAVIRLLDRRGCQALLRATYTDESSSLVLTVGIAVLRDVASATTAARYLTRDPTDVGAVTVRPVLAPVPVSGTPAASFGAPQRQISWAVSAGPYLVLATVGYADGRPHQPVRTDTYAYLEMTSLAGGVAQAVATPLGAAPRVPHCPGAPAC